MEFPTSWGSVSVCCSMQNTNGSESAATCFGSFDAVFDVVVHLWVVK